MKWVIERDEIDIAIADFVSKQIGRDMSVNVQIRVLLKNGIPETLEAIVTEENGEAE